MHGPWLRLSLAAYVSLFLAGCSSTPNCIGDQEYMQSVDRPRLQLPAHVTASERMAPLVIPPLGPTPTTLDPEPKCLDEPPPYATGKRPAPVEQVPLKQAPIEQAPIEQAPIEQGPGNG